MKADKTQCGCGSINSLMSLMGMEFAPHGSNGFKYTNQSHKLGKHPNDPAILVLAIRGAHLVQNAVVTQKIMQKSVVQTEIRFAEALGRCRTRCSST